MVDFENPDISTEEIVRILRQQKHDFLNYMQLISGYLQLGNLEKALDHLKTASRKIEQSGTIMGLAHPALSIKLLLRVHNAYRNGANIALSTTTDLRFLLPDKQLMHFLERVFSAIEEACFHNREIGNVQVQFSETVENYCMSINAESFNEDIFCCFVKQIEEAAAEFGEGVSVAVSEGAEVRVFFKKYQE